MHTLFLTLSCRYTSPPPLSTCPSFPFNFYLFLPPFLLTLSIPRHTFPCLSLIRSSSKHFHSSLENRLSFHLSTISPSLSLPLSLSLSLSLSISLSLFLSIYLSLKVYSSSFSLFFTHTFSLSRSLSTPISQSWQFPLLFFFSLPMNLSSFDIAIFLSSFFPLFINYLLFFLSFQ
ncbi:unnamed protein product [Acanthosepion pharaonis]|uniref:Uncharacterized protein n=1 Tax=Acanthosepion pharaonis TaxID=158019 RepID=A0A812DMU4_ACAPH|nr:unnamed protein product [Sepia pharaonis]